MGVAVRRYRYIDFLIVIITYLYSACISPFFGGSIDIPIYFFVHFLKVFLFLFMLFLCNNYNNYSKRCSKNIRDRSKIEITQTWRYNYNY